MDGAELQVRRHPADAVAVRTVAVVGVVGKPAAGELRPLPPRRLLACGQVEVDAGVRESGEPRPGTSAGSIQRAEPGPDSAGDRQPCLRQASKYGVNTLYGVPSPLLTRPGDTRYGDPVATSSTSPSASRTCSSRRRPKGEKSPDT